MVKKNVISVTSFFPENVYEKKAFLFNKTNNIDILT